MGSEGLTTAPQRTQVHSVGPTCVIRHPWMVVGRTPISNSSRDQIAQNWAPLIRTQVGGARVRSVLHRNRRAVWWPISTDGCCPKTNSWYNVLCVCDKTMRSPSQKNKPFKLSQIRKPSPEHELVFLQKDTQRSPADFLTKFPLLIRL